MVEQQTLNLQVLGSSPRQPTILRSLVSLVRRGQLSKIVFEIASVAELADALDLGSSSRKGVGVRLPSLAPNFEV